jgi:hypothetical protein
MATLAAYPEVAGVVRPAQPKKVRALGRAIAAADPAKAERAARALLEPDIDAFG